MEKRPFTLPDTPEELYADNHTSREGMVIGLFLAAVNWSFAQDPLDAEVASAHELSEVLATGHKVGVVGALACVAALGARHVVASLKARRLGD